MKAKSTSLTMYHFDEGHHREVCTWHDRDHKAEVIGAMPHVFISQRWVATPELVAARPPSTLEHHGGEYLNIYWSAGTASELDEDFRQLDARLRPLGRMEPMKYIQRTWGARLRPLSLHVRPDVLLSPEAVVCAVQNTGLMIVIEDLQDSDRRDAYLRWLESEQIPRVLETGLFSGAARLGAADGTSSVTYYYTDLPDPSAAYAAYREQEAAWNGFESADTVRQPIHSGMYLQSIGQYDYYP